LTPIFFGSVPDERAPAARTGGRRGRGFIFTGGAAAIAIRGVVVIAFFPGLKNTVPTGGVDLVGTGGGATISVGRIAVVTLFRAFDRAVPTDSGTGLCCAGAAATIPVGRVAKYGEPGLALRGARAKAELTQEALAKKLGIPQYEISKMENEKRPISKKMARRLAKILKTDYRVFL